MVEILSRGGFDDNFSYLLTSSDGSAAIVDPCAGCAEHPALRMRDKYDFKYIFLTHGHSDHFDALDDVKRLLPDVPVCAHRLFEGKCDVRLDDGASLAFGNSAIEVMFTPGHSRDSLVYIYKEDNALFTGDTLFVGCIGFCRSPRMMAESLEKLLALPGELVVYSGHDYGSVPSRTLAEERVNNPEITPAFLEKLRQSGS